MARWDTCGTALKRWRSILFDEKFFTPPQKFFTPLFWYEGKNLDFKEFYLFLHTCDEKNRIVTNFWKSQETLSSKSIHLQFLRRNVARIPVKVNFSEIKFEIYHDTRKRYRQSPHITLSPMYAKTSIRIILSNQDFFPHIRKGG